MQPFKQSYKQLYNESDKQPYTQPYTRPCKQPYKQPYKQPSKRPSLLRDRPPSPPMPTTDDNAILDVLDQLNHAHHKERLLEWRRRCLQEAQMQVFRARKELSGITDHLDSLQARHENEIRNLKQQISDQERSLDRGEVEAAQISAAKIEIAERLVAELRSQKEDAEGKLASARYS